MKKPLGPCADMRGSALTQGRVCALGKYEDSSHDPTVEHLGGRVNKRVRAISSSGRIVRQMDRPRGAPSNWEYQPPGVSTTDRAACGAAHQLAVLGQDTAGVLG